MRALRALPLLLVTLAACGDDGSATVDAPIAIDAAVDAGLPAGCDYAEQRDLTNDDTSSGTAEETGLTFGTKSVLCGTFESTHFDDITVDVDSFTLTLAAASDVLVRLDGTSLSGPELVGVDIYAGTTKVGDNTVIGGHAVTALHLSAGRHTLQAFALNTTAIGSSLPYRIDVSVDAPATRCPEVMVGGFAEANDGGGSTDNDMIRLASIMPALTASTTDMPEPTALTLAAGANTRVTGSAADVTVADLYEDVDTFAIATGAGVNELAVRLTWPGTTTNLDFILFEAGNPDPVLRAIGSATTAPELRTFGVKPAQSYWLLVGAKAGTAGLPSAYTASLCGATFTP